MRLFTSIIAPAIVLLLSDAVAGAAAAAAAGTWGFEGASVSVAVKKSEHQRNKAVFHEHEPVPTPLVLPPGGSLKVQLTTTEKGKPARPHQAFLVLSEHETGLEAPFVFSVDWKGEASISVAHDDLPLQLLESKKSLRGSIIVASFGSTPGSVNPVFDVAVELDPTAPPLEHKKPVRYGKKEEIRHIFREDPRSPPKAISAFFSVAVIAALPALLVAWLSLGANANHLTKALSAAPLSHLTFFGSIVAMEGVFIMYYVSWNLIQTLPAIGAVGTVAVLSGMRALGEVQSRRFGGER